MRYLYVILLILVAQNHCYAQWPNPENERLTQTMIGFMNRFGGGGFNPVAPASNDYSYDPSIYSNNSYQQQMRNSLTYAEVYFQKRQINMYYRNLEQIQKEEIKALKKSKLMTVSELNRIFNR